MKTLIAYASKYGCAKKCAIKLSEKLSGEVDIIDLKAQETPDLSMYETIIIGGSIYMGQIQKQVTKFCKKNTEILKQKRLGLYICCMFTGEKAKNQLKNAFPNELLNIAAAKEIFGGEIIIDKLKLMDRIITKMVAGANDSTDAPKIDSKLGMSLILTDRIDSFCNTINLS